MPKNPPTRMGSIEVRNWGDGGLDNSAAPNNQYAKDRGGVVTKAKPEGRHGVKGGYDMHKGNRGNKAI